MAYELSVAIRHQAFWNAMKPYYLLEVEVSYLGGIMSDIVRDEIGHF